LNRYTKQGRRIQVLRNRDKMKDDAIAQLSDQVMDATALLFSIHTYMYMYAMNLTSLIQNSVLNAGWY